MADIQERLERLEKQEREMHENEGDSGKLRDDSYFRYELFTDNLDIDDEQREAARTVNSKEELHDIKITFGYQNSESLVGNAECTTGHYGKVRIMFTRDKVVSTFCTKCTRISYTFESALGYRLCEHELALLFRIQDYLRRNDIGDETDIRSAVMLTRFRRSRADRYSEKIASGEFGIKPCIRVSPKYSRLTFRAEIDKDYTLRNIPEFIDAVRNERTYKFSSLKEMKVSYEMMRSDADRELFDMMYDYYAEEKLRNELYGQKEQDSTSSGSQSYIMLFGAQLDRLYSILDKHQIPVIIDDGKKKMTLKTGSSRLPISVTITDSIEDDAYRGIRLEGTSPRFLKGHRGYYYYDDTTLYRVDDAEVSRVLPFFSAIDPDGRISMSIGKNRISEFYNDVMPVLTQYIKIEDRTKETQKHIIPFPELVLYMDMDEETVFLKGDIIYGDSFFSLGDAYETYRDKLKLPAQRNSEAEKYFLRKVIQYFDAYDDRRKIFYINRDDDRIFTLLDEGIEDFLSFAEVRTTENFMGRRILKNIPISLGVSIESDLLDLEIQSDLPKDQLAEILSSYQQKKKYIKLKSGAFLKILENGSLQEISDIVKHTGIDANELIYGRAQVPLYRALYLDKALSEAEYLDKQRNNLFKDVVKNFKTIGDQDFHIPESLVGQLKPYQRTGYRFLKTLEKYGFGGILADDMGLGKTVQVITVLEENRLEGKYREPSLIACPASLVFNWGEEFRKFAPDMEVLLINGPAEHRKMLLENAAGYDVIVVSYDTLRRDIDIFSKIQFSFMIIDEAQYIKNINTGIRKAVKEVDSRIRYALTGTPIENKLSELWSIFDFLMPGYLYTYAEFRNEFESPIVKDQDEHALSELKRLISPFILRRKKEEVLKDLPPKLQEDRYVNLEDRQRLLYDAQVSRMLDEIHGKNDYEFNRSKIQILSELIRARQLCCDPSLVFTDYDGSSAKREATIDLIRSSMESGHKALVFSQFTSMLMLLEEDLKKEGIAYYRITGSTPKEERVELVNRFNADDVPVFLISLKAGGTGLNLIGADIVIHYDPWWNIAVQDQATDRAHRIGQNKVVTVFRMIAKNTIEEKIIELQQRKKELAEDILSGEGISSSLITREDLEFILGKSI